MGGRWRPDASEFVGVSYSEGSAKCTVPMPIVRLPGIEVRITFKVSGDSVMVLPDMGRPAAPARRSAADLMAPNRPVAPLPPRRPPAS